MKRWYDGSCHCGAIRYRANLDIEAGTSKCNCTFCWKQRNWNLPRIPPEDFELVSGEDALSSYARKTDSFEMSHMFCSKCGTQTHGKGYMEQMGGAFTSVRVATIDDLPVRELVAAPVALCDGLHDSWWTTPDETRHL